MTDVLPAPRFVVRDVTGNDITESWLVIDSVLEVDVFHWYGRTGRSKCEAVCAALNSVDDGSGE
jgi:hypothetical protein